ncbi:MAG: alanine dehydrogenase [Cyanobacteria bacterium J06641_5]
MDIGVPKEIKDREYRVGLSPSSVRALSDRGHDIFLETQAGVGAGFSDGDYERAGATIVADAAAAWDRTLTVKIKEPLASEYQYLQRDRLLFTYLHLAAVPALARALVAAGTIAIAYETVQLPNGQLPLLAPMSIIAGRLAVQLGAHYLERAQGGRGILLGGIPGVAPGTVTVLGGGTVGTEAARMAIGLGARVQILDISVDRLMFLETLFGSRVELLHSSASTIEATVPGADLLVGGVLVPGRRAPVLVSRELVAQMRPGAVILDVAIDQGGCIATLRPTSHSAPTYLEAGVVHCGIPNLPGAVPHTATQALNHSTLPYVLDLADRGLDALKDNVALAGGLTSKGGRLVHPAAIATFPELT